MKRLTFVFLVILCSIGFTYAQGAVEERNNSITLELRQDQTFVETIYFESHEKSVVYYGTYTFDSDTLILNATSPVERQFVFTYKLEDRVINETDISDVLVLGWDDNSLVLERYDHTSETPNAIHVWDDGETTTAPTCTVEGIKTQTCIICGTTKTSAIFATGHTIVDGVCTTCGSSSPSPFSISRTGELKVNNKNLLSSVVEIPETIDGIAVMSIASYTFQNCSDVSEIVIPDSVVSIGSSAFRSCSNLSRITIPETVTKLGDSVFLYCKQLEDINIDGNNNFYQAEGGILYNKDKSMLLEYPSASGEVVIPDSVEGIEEYAFYSCSGLTSITIPKTVTYIGHDAFQNCSSLTAFFFKGTSEQWNGIIKGSDWNGSIPATVVHCSDVDVEIE